MRWASVSNRLYRIERSVDLLTAEWQGLAGLHLGNGTAMAATVSSASDGGTFYRLLMRDTPVVHASEFGPRNDTTITNLLYAIGRRESVLQLGGGNWEVARAVRIPSNVVVSIGVGSTLDGSGVIAFDGGFLTDGTCQVFAAEMAVSGLTQAIRPEWWGFAREAAGTVNAGALSRAVSAAGQGATVEIPAGRFNTGAVRLYATNVVIRGRRAGVYDPESATLRGGTCIAGSLSISGRQYGLEGLGVTFCAESGDPMVNLQGESYQIKECFLVGDTNAPANAHNLYFGGTNGMANNVVSYNCWGHGVASKSVGLTVDGISTHNCKYGVTVKSGTRSYEQVESNVFRNVSTTGDNRPDACGLIVMACNGVDMRGVTVTGFQAMGLGIGVDIEASSGSTVYDVTIQDAKTVECDYGYRSYMSSPGVMTNVALVSCTAERSSIVGYFQQAPGTWIDVLDSSAVACAHAVSGHFRTADIEVAP